MTPTKDIIGVVKELQQERINICNTTLVKPDYEGDIQRAKKYNDNVVWHFPAIAEALMIAVESLQKTVDVACGDPDCNHCGRCFEVAWNALSKIRSLPL